MSVRLRSSVIHNSKIAKVLKEYIEHGGITGGETPGYLEILPAKLGSVLGIAFDPKRHKCEEHPEPSENLVAYTVKSNDGREAYFEVKHGKIYALVSKGLNIEIWRRLLVIGARTDRQVDKVKKRSVRAA